MFSTSFFKTITPISPMIEQTFIEEIESVNSKVWFSALQHPDGSIDFVKNNPNSGFYTATLRRFPNIVNYISQQYPDVVIKNSYVTKMLPGYCMKPHIDKNRDTVILMPLGENKGEIDFYILNFKCHTHVYTCPILARVDKLHAANNTSTDTIRYALTLEIPGTYNENKHKYN